MAVLGTFAQASRDELRSSHRTLRRLYNTGRMSSLQQTHKSPLPIPFPISIWTQSHSARLTGPATDGWRTCLVALDEGGRSLYRLARRCSR